MPRGDHGFLDIAVIGGGPAGISACLELSKSSNLKVGLFEKEPELGGIPRSCHNIFFGMRDLRRMMSGPKYARRLTSMLQKTAVEIYRESTVDKVVPGNNNELHQVHVVSPSGFRLYKCRSILLTTGCFEISRAARMIPGKRPAGIYTTGALQEMVNVRNHKVGNCAVIIGSEHVALSSILTLKRKGISIVGLVEEDLKLNTFPLIARAMAFIYRVPIYKGTTVASILDHHRVKEVTMFIEERKQFTKLKCDTVIITGKFRPYSSLIDFTPIKMDPNSYGPMIDSDYMTSVPNIFAAGNILRGADMHDICALEGKRAAKNILRRMESLGYEQEEGINLKVEEPIRYVVPQKILHDQIKSKSLRSFFSGCSIQVENSLDKPVLEAWSGNKVIWSRSYRRLIGNHRIPIPVREFDLSRVDKKSAVTLRIH
jgi:thioredoxin reductase